MNTQPFNFKKKKKESFMAPFYGWGSTASRLEPFRGGSLLFTTKFPEIPGTHFIDLGRMKRLSRPWSHSVVLNTGPLDWESSALTTRSNWPNDWAVLWVRICTVHLVQRVPWHSGTEKIITHNTAQSFG